VLDAFGIPDSDVAPLVETIDAKRELENVRWVITKFFDFVCVRRGEYSIVLVYFT
jgi:hypothetical protein